ncbi:MAG TPA: aminotransferase class I/II-fold pyridoxal phosphate-dependent enzyme [Spirochaetota bacterium]|nr:aminotransferase class I/II-fold pyridoxal phosphate-dependent enzyme [Spirochaetota bacterium]HPC41326.1 aminotransferase class I/II-fold pyridoxal phosphate-dependent enzyme [Spirochaetota bacterium]HPL15421.1 aminotransferase class I/II-fold pyridoxal phosphate-dependent enzyme [Spirochaetota bacterium]HQF09743.1 aminotransferase class I/II-fold pyridoxal phosphate-dependent enzyme [Spirochaetota bacterium]HQH98892.1 aminotransferase class I/II-fold pyridoxal phosphate-dependent enzyme [S
MTGTGNRKKTKEGQAAERLQEKLAELVPLRHVIATGYTRNALFLLIRAMRWDGSAEIIIPAFTCPVIRHTISEAGPVPVPVDAEDDGINIDPDKIIHAITGNTKAIYVVHTYGMTAQIERICAIAKKHEITVIEDLAHAPFSTYRGRQLGTYGDVALWSFTKKMVNFEGGAIGTNDSSLYARMAMLQREYAQKRSFGPIFLIEIFVRLVGSWWESSFSIIPLMLMKLNDAINSLLFRGSYGLSIDSAAFTPTGPGCRMTLRQIDRLYEMFRGNNGRYLKQAGAASDILMYRTNQKGADTLPFYITGIPAGRQRLYRLISFRTWHNSNRPGLYPRADYLYENYRIFSKAVRLFLPERKAEAVRPIRVQDTGSQKKNMKQPTLTDKRGII